MKHYVLALWSAVAGFDEKGGFAASAHIAMTLLLAVFPFLVFVVSVAGILGAGTDPDMFVTLVFGTWPEAAAGPLVREIQAVLTQSNGATLGIGLILALFFASNGVEAVRRAITVAYRDHDPRPVWTTRVLSLLFVMVGTLLLIGVSAIQIGLPQVLNRVSDGEATFAITFLGSDLFRNAITLAVLIFAVLACHLWLPGHQKPVRRVLPGTTITLLLWYAAGKGFAFYLAHLADYSVTYAGLAGIMATLIFLNLMAAIFILGAEFNAQLADLRRRECRPTRAGKSQTRLMITGVRGAPLTA